MWSVRSSAESAASPDEVWLLLSDPSGWPSWNPTVSEVSVSGPVAEGTTGTFKPRRGPKAKIAFRDVRPVGGFTTVSHLPGAALGIEHQLERAPGGGSVVTERAVLSGPLARMWAAVLGRQLARDMREAVEGLAQAASK